MSRHPHIPTAINPTTFAELPDFQKKEARELAAEMKKEKKSFEEIGDTIAAKYKIKLTRNQVRYWFTGDINNKSNKKKTITPFPFTTELQAKSAVSAIKMQIENLLKDVPSNEKLGKMAEYRFQRREIIAATIDEEVLKRLAVISRQPDGTLMERAVLSDLKVLLQAADTYNTPISEVMRLGQYVQQAEEINAVKIYDVE